MNKDLFNDLMQGLNQASDYVNGKSVKVKKTKLVITTVPSYGSKEVKMIRDKLNMTQKSFAGLLGVSLRTVESWENGINQPSGPSIRLMEIYSVHPELVNEIIFRETTN